MEIDYDLSIVIVNYNVTDLLVNCINSIYNYEKRLNFEIFVIDNNSDENVAEGLSDFLENDNFNLIINKENFGFAKANNQVLDHFRGKYVLFLNPDTEIKQQDSFNKIVEILDKDQKVGICGPKILFGDGSLQLSCGNFPTPFRLLSEVLFLTRFFPLLFPGYRFPNWKHDERRYVDWVSGACLFIRRDIFIGLSGFDEKLIFYIEDVDLCYRTRLLGHKILYEPSVEILHFEGQSSRKSRETAVISGFMSKLNFYSKYYKKRYVNLVKLGFILSSMIKIIVLFPMRLLKPDLYKSIFRSYTIALKRLIKYNLD